MKLTPAQQQLVEDNHNLIYGFLREYNLPQDEYYDLAAIGLCKAAKCFNKDKGSKFSCYAYLVMLTEVKMYWRKERKCVKPSCSLDDIVLNGDHMVTLAEIIAEPNDISAYITAPIDRLCTELVKHNERYPKILMMLCNGYTQKTMGTVFGVSQSTISKDIIKIKGIVKEIL